METEGGFKDPLKSKESEQEQEWKLRQVSKILMYWYLEHHPPPNNIESERKINTTLLSQTDKCLSEVIQLVDWSADPHPVLSRRSLHITKSYMSVSLVHCVAV